MTILRNRLLARVVAPANEPIMLSEAKLYLRVDNSNEDTLINDLIVAARMMAEHCLKRSLITQTWKLSFDDYLCDEVTLPMGPVISISNVAIIDRDNSSLTVDSSQYTLNAAKSAVVFDGVIEGFRIEISYSAGYGNASAVPKPIKLGMLAHIAAMYDGRGDADSSALPNQSLAAYAPYRELLL